LPRCRGAQASLPATRSRCSSPFLLCSRPPVPRSRVALKAFSTSIVLSLNKVDRQNRVSLSAEPRRPLAPEGRRSRVWPRALRFVTRTTLLSPPRSASWLLVLPGASRTPAASAIRHRPHRAPPCSPLAMRARAARPPGPHGDLLDDHRRGNPRAEQLHRRASPPPARLAPRCATRPALALSRSGSLWRRTVPPVSPFCS
jgi:hypothetical protein